MATDTTLLAAAAARYVVGLAVVLAILLGPAGTWRWWPAWTYCAALFGPMLVMLVVLARRDPELLRRRMQTRERRAPQRTIVTLLSIGMLAGFSIPGFDHRFGWSHVPPALVIAADVAVLAGYGLFARVMLENSWAGRTIEVTEAQAVIDTGPYAYVRHPMYSAMVVVMLATPLALASWWALPPFLLAIPMLVLRIRDEEAALREDLAGYAAYCDEVRHRLVPGVW